MIKVIPSSINTYAFRQLVSIKSRCKLQYYEPLYTSYHGSTQPIDMNQYIKAKHTLKRQLKINHSIENNTFLAFKVMDNDKPIDFKNGMNQLKQESSSSSSSSLIKGINLDLRSIKIEKKKEMNQINDILMATREGLNDSNIPITLFVDYDQTRDYLPNLFDMVKRDKDRRDHLAIEFDNYSIQVDWKHFHTKKIVWNDMEDNEKLKQLVQNATSNERKNNYDWCTYLGGGIDSVQDLHQLTKDYETNPASRSFGFLVDESNLAGNPYFFNRFIIPTYISPPPNFQHLVGFKDMHYSISDQANGTGGREENIQVTELLSTIVHHAMLAEEAEMELEGMSARLSNTAVIRPELEPHIDGYLQPFGNLNNKLSEDANGQIISDQSNNITRLGQLLLSVNNSREMVPILNDFLLFISKQYGCSSTRREDRYTLDNYSIKGAPHLNDIAMDLASSNGFIDIVKYLHENRTGKCITRGMDQAANNHLDVVKFLHFNRTEGCSSDALDGAAENGNLEIVKFLIQHRTEGGSKDAMDLAAQNNHIEIVKVCNNTTTLS
ncbi:hypothetical protein DFA_04404 [Cavenderia fasciculata]|uniref:Ankyrin repeat-containing protein n=1 Tax=Cavenderia fasciculata TaxID=261658 RepID=F4PPH3_CACFS|nr:uncharacterized protein DFA_04404 [Cavenderia fasciculata]EGG22286.1 hypothetical protein DFA_04404 [Cavenderia fasciculata]|eukprot:XP_004360137.1 hypothetical protein DFA_04404 [Cavenderia fasciculata]